MDQLVFHLITKVSSASTQLDRESGFVGCLKEKHLTLSHREVGNFLRLEAQDAAKRMFKYSNRPTAVFVASDHMAFAVMDVLRTDLGLKIPEDVSVIGFDDVSLASYSAYDLTTIKQPIGQMVDSTVNILLDQISLPQDKTNKIIKLDPYLIIRSSTSKLKETE